jgi:cold shock CspA family protein
MLLSKSLRQFSGVITKECVMQEIMYGVVLWADDAEDKAVIWCEDHGNLAYYSKSDQNMHDGVSLDAGDLIQFDLREDAQGRFARNLRHVNSGYAPTLPQSLKRQTPAQRPSPRPVAKGNVVPFKTLCDA